ncbi:MAG: FAD-binding oxidoreductase [Sciscionella sp.]
MADIAAELATAAGEGNLSSGADASTDYRSDEGLTSAAVMPAFVATPADADAVARLVTVAAAHRMPVIARGSGSGLSGAAVPVEGSLVISFERMNAILEVDETNQVAVVQAGVTLAQLDQALAATGLCYPVYPGELGGSIGGNVNTNAGGMRAIKYGVTRANVLGLSAVLADGRRIDTGGRITKCSSGYDLTQLVIGSEGTLALVTEIIVKLSPRPEHFAAVLAPFTTLEEVIGLVPDVVNTGVGPAILEYIDGLTMGAITHSAELTLGIAESIRDTAQAYLLVGLESGRADRLAEDVERVGELLSAREALEVYVLEGPTARAIVSARETAFYAAKAMGANDIVDIVLPRAAMPAFLSETRARAVESGIGLVGCGHAGDGNVHLAVFCPDATQRSEFIGYLLAEGLAAGGAISGEHGIGRGKKRYFAELTDPTTLALLRGVKHTFDPLGILNPGVIFEAQ